jgi:hypothetical protein
MARKHGPERQQWKGIDANERAFGTVRNALVAIALDGVAGVSPEIPGEGRRMISPEDADRYIAKGRQVLADFESQEMAPGGARGHAQKWMDRTIDELRKLVTDAEAVRSGKKPQKLRKHLGVGEAGRRRAAPQPPEPVTAPSHDAPPGSFTSAGGRTFTLGPVDRSTPRYPRPGALWPILYNGEQAGKLFQDENYGPDMPWHATTRELYWKFASDAPTGVGFDVSAFATAQQALAAWGRSADQILDWAEGKPVHGMYGRHQRTAEARRYPQPKLPPRQFVAPRVADFNTLDDLIIHARQDGFLDPRDWHGSAVEYANQMSAQPQAAREDRRRGPRTGQLTRSTARPGTPVRVADPDSMYRGMTGTVVEPRVDRVARLDDYSKRFLRGEGTVLVETQRGELFVIHARALERLGTAITRAMDRDSRRGPRRQR